MLGSQAALLGKSIVSVQNEAEAATVGGGIARRYAFGTEYRRLLVGNPRS
jgi:hypothetical protein